jgi:tight adherence protein C
MAHLPFLALVVLLVVLSGLTGLALVLRFLQAEQAGQRLRRTVGAPGEAARRDTGRWNWLRALGRRLLGSGQAAEETARTLRLAGFWSPDAAAIFAGLRLVLSLAACLGFWVLMQNNSRAVAYAALAGLAFAVLMTRLLKGHAEGRAARMRAELPSFIGLVVLGLEGGAGVEHAMRFAADQSGAPTPALSPALGAMTRDLDGGMPHDAALARLSELAPVDELRLCTDLVRQSLRFGTELIVPLRALAVEFGEQRLARGRENVGSATVKMTVVMVATFLPALLVLLGAPAFSKLITGLSQMGHR